jgi:DNA-directed RNA polymerase specialized sigma24 family protein
MSIVQTDEGPITTWIKGVQQGDQVALQNIWVAYWPRLLAISRRQLSRRVARCADEEDLVVSAIWCFYRQARNGRYPELHDRQALWKLLVAITLNKTRALGRKEDRRIKCLKKHFGDEPLPEEEPAPDVAAQLSDQLAHLMWRLKDPVLCEVATAKLEGQANAEIARRIGKSVPTIERKLKLIRLIWSLAKNA